MVPCVRSAAGEDACGAPRDDWTDTEVAAATFADARLHRRFAGLLRQLAAGVGTTIPQACGDWAGAKAAYRFLSNGRVARPTSSAAISRRRPSGSGRAAAWS